MGITGLLLFVAYLEFAVCSLMAYFKVKILILHDIVVFNVTLSLINLFSIRRFCVSWFIAM